MPYTGARRTGKGKLNTSDTDLLDILIVGLASTAPTRTPYDAAEHDMSFAVYER